MKRLLILLSTILFMLLSGCSKSGQPDNELSDELTDIPETLIVDTDLPKNLPSEASTYKVSYKDFDSRKLLELFHMNPDSVGERDAFGPRFESGDSFLCVYDDKGVLPGGLNYCKNMSDLSTIGSIVNLCQETDTDFMKDHASDNFSDTEALSFLETLGLEQGLGQLRVHQAYEFSGEELNEFLKSSDESTSQDEDTFNPESHYSYVYLSQFINDIPFITFPWGLFGGTQTYSRAGVLISENQALDIEFAELYDVEQEISNSKIISPERALNTFIADYNKKMQFDTTTITNISLYYVVTIDKDGMYAQPAYVIEYEYKAKSEDSPEPTTIKGENKTISAITGEFILSAEVKN